MFTEQLKARLIAQIRVNEELRLKIESKPDRIKYWKDQLIKSEGICEGLRIAFELLNKYELNQLKKVA